jgi:hypothetical protein
VVVWPGSTDQIQYFLPLPQQAAAVVVVQTQQPEKVAAPVVVRQMVVLRLGPERPIKGTRAA